MSAVEEDNSISRRIEDKLGLSRQKGEHEVEVLGLTYTVLPSVFSPGIFLGTEWLARVLPYPAGGDFLEIGCGCGCLTVEAKRRGCARVVGVDVNPSAVACLNLNASRLGVEVEALESDVFSALTELDTFDLIFWNFPFHPTEKALADMDFIERAVRDPAYCHLARYCQQAARHLKPGGRVAIAFSKDMGDLSSFFRIVQESGWTAEEQGEAFRSSPQSPVSISLWLLQNSQN